MSGCYIDKFRSTKIDVLRHSLIRLPNYLLHFLSLMIRSLHKHIFGGINFYYVIADHYLMLAKVRERLSVSQREIHL